MSHQLLILRPSDQIVPLQDMLAQRAQQQQVDLHMEAYSMIKISAYDDPNHSMRQILSESWDGGLMVSVNAANFFAEQVQAWAPEMTIPTMRWFAVGPTSARAISKVVNRPVTCPWRQHNSDTLLALPELQDVEGQNWLIVRGRGGRDLFANTMQARGAKVTFLEVYKRTQESVSTTTLERWQQQVQGIMVTSAEQLGYFLAAIPTPALSWLQSCYWIVASQRLAELLPISLRSNVVVADSAASFALVDAWQQVIDSTKEA